MERVPESGPPREPSGVGARGGPAPGTAKNPRTDNYPVLRAACLTARAEVGATRSPGRIGFHFSSRCRLQFRRTRRLERNTSTGKSSALSSARSFRVSSPSTGTDIRTYVRLRGGSLLRPVRSGCWNAPMPDSWTRSSPTPGSPTATGWPRTTRIAELRTRIVKMRGREPEAIHASCNRRGTGAVIVVPQVLVCRVVTPGRLPHGPRRNRFLGEHALSWPESGFESDVERGQAPAGAGAK